MERGARIEVGVKLEKRETERKGEEGRISLIKTVESLQYITTRHQTWERVMGLGFLRNTSELMLRLCEDSSSGFFTKETADIFDDSSKTS